MSPEPSIWAFYRGANGRLEGLERTDTAWKRHCLGEQALSRHAPAVLSGARTAAVLSTMDDGRLECWAWSGREGPAAGTSVIEGLDATVGTAPAVAMAGGSGGSGDRVVLAFGAPGVVSGSDAGRLFCARRDGPLDERGRWGEAEAVDDVVIAPYSSPVLSRTGSELALFYLRQPSPDRFPALFWRRSSGSGNEWGSEEEIVDAGRLTRAPAVLESRDGFRLLYWRPGIGLDRQGLFTMAWSARSGWAGERGPLGGILDSSPAAATTPDGRDVLVFAGTSRSLWFREGSFDEGLSAEVTVLERLESDPALFVV